MEIRLDTAAGVVDEPVDEAELTKERGLGALGIAERSGEVDPPARLVCRTQPTPAPGREAEGVRRSDAQLVKDPDAELVKPWNSVTGRPSPHVSKRISTSPKSRISTIQAQQRPGGGPPAGGSGPPGRSWQPRRPD